MVSDLLILISNKVSQISLLICVKAHKVIGMITRTNVLVS